MKTAAGTWGVVERNGTNLWSGYLDASGCSIVLPFSTGTFKFFMTGAVRVAAGGGTAVIWVTPTATSGFRWFSKNWGTVGPGTFWANLGSGDTTASAAAVAVEMMGTEVDRWTAGVTTKVFTELSGNEGDYGNNTVNLGTDEYTGTWVSRLKTVVAHELGHAIQDNLFGFQLGPRNQNAAEELCLCDHIDFPALRSHCMTGREHIGFAQSEGFAQFVAAETLNSGFSAAPKFAYYKEVRTTSGGPDLYPPVIFSAYSASAYYRWMSSHGCNAANSGTELDWMTFFYELNREFGGQLFSYTDIANIFKDVCGGSCNNAGSTLTSFAALTAAVNARFGSTSNKAKKWALLGANHGVNF